MEKIYMREEFGEVLFSVNGDKYTDKELMLVIPYGYKHLFNGASFKSMTELSRAVSFARCAFEARMHGVPHLVRQNEKCLERCFN